MPNPPVEGDSNLTNTAGVTGTNSAASAGIGVLGTSINGEGVHGETHSTQFAAVAGIELNQNSPVTAVFGQHNGSGPGIFGTSQGGEGVHGETNGNNVAAVGAINKANGPAVFGISQGGEGVHGETHSTQFAAVAGIELNQNSPVAAVFGQHNGGGPGLFGISQGGEGVHGETSSDAFAAVAGINKGPATLDKNPAGVFGSSQNGEGVHGETTSATVAAVAGFNNSQSGTGAGIYGQSIGQGPAGFFTTNTGIPGLGDAVFAESGPTGSAVHGVGGTNAGLFEGTVRITGGSLSVEQSGGVGGEISAVSIFASNKHFRIDHPLDPANKYLIHTTIESSERLNLYGGVAVLDRNGQAEVVLPEWFEALNGDFRYQLTCIGGFAPVYIAAKISNNRFRIAGGYAGLEVSWQVAGLRQDRWAQEHPLLVVVDKPVREPLTSNEAQVPGQPVPCGISIAGARLGG